MDGVEFRIVDTRAGALGFVATRHGLRRVFLPKRSAAEARRAVAGEFPAARENGRLMPGLAAALMRYFEGRPVEFDVPFDWSDPSPFARRVWQACAAVRYGGIATYRGLAQKVGRPAASRAVGAAMGRNPCPIVVPCHRVLRSDGSLGGYSAPGGLKLKRELLKLEAGGMARRS